MSEMPSRNLGLDLVRVTEAAALAAGRWMGLGQRQGADQAATAAVLEIIGEQEGAALLRVVLETATTEDREMAERLGDWVINNLQAGQYFRSLRLLNDRSLTAFDQFSRRI